MIFLPVATRQAWKGAADSGGDPVIPSGPMTPDEIREELAELNPEALTADGFDEALVGVGRQFNKALAVYSYEACVAVLIGQGLSEQEAIEHMEFNVVGAYMGEHTPIFLQ